MTPPGQTDYLREGDQPINQHIRHEQSLQRGHLQVDCCNGILASLLGLLVLVDMKARTTKSSSLYTLPNDGYQLGKADLANLLLEERLLLTVDQTPLLD